MKSFSFGRFKSIILSWFPWLISKFFTNMVAGSNKWLGDFSWHFWMPKTPTHTHMAHLVLFLGSRHLVKSTMLVHHVAWTQRVRGLYPDIIRYPNSISCVFINGMAMSAYFFWHFGAWQCGSEAVGLPWYDSCISSNFSLLFSF